ncbi:nitrite reductase small subunit NirD [Demequina sp. NBRC 110055]|uniref:nitrite reductase small subunit NirD n=1 Tax=Demequina sp. NBRC 110055 TaxID=1570344 RepID=UPI0009FF6DEE|nr:nitrite reductase small subunit NirD [Demequina sp. NBRC 110055]
MTTVSQRAAVPTASTDRTAVCAYDRLTADLGVAALIDGVQVAIFRLADGTVHAVQNLDPFSGAHVMSRGITGTRGDEPTIASPLYKQVFSLLSGECLVTMDKAPREGLDPRLTVFAVTVHDGLVYVDVPGAM